MAVTFRLRQYSVSIQQELAESALRAAGDDEARDQVEVATRVELKKALDDAVGKVKDALKPEPLVGAEQRLLASVEDARLGLA